MNFYQFKITFTLRVNITRIPLWKRLYVQLSTSLPATMTYRNFCKENSMVLSLPACSDQLYVKQNKVKPPKSNTKLESL